MLGHNERVLRWGKTYQEQLQQQHQQKQHAFEPRGLAWPGWPCWAGAVSPAADSCCTDICLFRISIRSDPMGYRQRRGTEFSIEDVRNRWNGDFILWQENLCGPTVFVMFCSLAAACAGMPRGHTVMECCFLYLVQKYGRIIC